MAMVAVSSWGRLTSDDHEVLALSELPDVQAHMQACRLPGLAYGMGRSYGDVCLNPGGTLWRTSGLNRFISFDSDTGRLVCEAGVLLRDIQRLAIPRGWALPVTPGTQIVTVGGAIANDVHGKNHHVMGSFGDNVLSLRLIRTNGDVLDCGPRQQAPWFAATVGGLGLTGVIVQAELQLRRCHGPWLSTETLPYAGVDEFCELADASEADWEYTVSWIDCMSPKGRGVFMRANHADAGQLPMPARVPRTMPIVPPMSLVNRLSLKPFNFLYFHMNRMKATRGLDHYQPFFYPLDNLLEWNRMYGPKGFFQYQSVVPRNVGKDAVKEMLNVISRSGQGSFLAVLKTFGDRQASGMLSFPQPGITLALDFPNRGSATHRLLMRLDEVVRSAGGRIYPAKDARMPRELFEVGYPRLPEFLAYRDPGISSALSRRLIGS